MKIIGISGQTGAGKSAFADRLIEAHGYVRVDFGTEVKNEIIRHLRKTLIAHLIDRNPELAKLDHRDERWNAHIRYVMFNKRTPLTRAIQQEWGMMRREQDPRYWVWKWAGRVEALKGERVVCDNVRFVNEAEMIRTMGGRLIKIERPGLEVAPMAADDPTERGLTGWTDWDAVVTNAGDLEDLANLADAVAG